MIEEEKFIEIPEEELEHGKEISEQIKGEEIEEKILEEERLKEERERQEKEKEKMEKIIEVFEKKPKLLEDLIDINYEEIIKFGVSLPPKEKLRTVEGLRELRPGLFEFFQRRATPEFFKEFTVAFAKVMKGKEVYCTIHQPFEQDNVRMRLWSEQPPSSKSGHPDWGINSEKGVLEAKLSRENIMGKRPVKELGVIEELKKELQSDDGRIVLTGGDYTPYYLEYRMRSKQEKK